MGRSLTEILEENEAWRASHLHVYDGYCQPCAERDAERSRVRLAAAEKVIKAARVWAKEMHAYEMGEETHFPAVENDLRDALARYEKEEFDEPR